MSFRRSDEMCQYRPADDSIAGTGGAAHGSRARGERRLVTPDPSADTLQLNTQPQMRPPPLHLARPRPQPRRMRLHASRLSTCPTLPLAPTVEIYPFPFDAADIFSTHQQVRVQDLVC